MKILLSWFLINTVTLNTYYLLNREHCTTGDLITWINANYFRTFGLFHFFSEFSSINKINFSKNCKNFMKIRIFSFTFHKKSTLSLKNGMQTIAQCKYHSLPKATLPFAIFAQSLKIRHQQLKRNSSQLLSISQSDCSQNVSHSVPCDFINCPNRDLHCVE